MRRGSNPLAEPEILLSRVYAYIAYRIGSGPEAEDLTSDVLERALRYRDSYDAQKGPPIAWLLGIARQCIAAARQKCEPVFTESAPEGQEADFGEDAIRRLSLADSMAALSDRDRELLALRYGADLTAREIAALMDSETNTIEVALHRALGKLRDVLTHVKGEDETAEV